MYVCILAQVFSMAVASTYPLEILPQAQEALFKSLVVRVPVLVVMSELDLVMARPAAVT
jgi:hypothetical protein